MRTVTSSINIGGSSYSLTMTYPNATAFIFSPQPIVITGGPDTMVAEIGVRATGGDVMTELRESFGGKVYADISRILQITSGEDPEDTYTNYSATESRAGIAVNYDVTIRVSDKNSPGFLVFQTFKIVGIFGALDLGEDPGADEERRYWIDWPMTIPASYGVSNIEFEAGGKTNLVPLSHPQAKGINDFNLPDLISGAVQMLPQVQKGATLYAEMLGYMSVTPSGTETTRTKRITFRTCRMPADKGVCIRWIGRRGELCHWVFRKGSRLLETSEALSFKRYYDRGISYYSRNLGQNSNKVTYTSARGMTLGTANVTDGEFDLLCTLAESPVVEMMTGGSVNSPTWQRVVVSAGSFERSSKPGQSLQDFAITISLPQRNTLQL